MFSKPLGPDSFVGYIVLDISSQLKIIISFYFDSWTWIGHFCNNQKLLRAARQ